MASPDVKKPPGWRFSEVVMYEDYCQCYACKAIRPATSGHLSDCAVHNEPAYPAGPCDCGRKLRAERKFLGWFLCCAHNQALRLKTMYRSWIWRELRGPAATSNRVLRWIYSRLPLGNS